MTAKRKQRKPDPEALEMAGYVVVVTTLQELNPVSVLGLYRHRWQTELAFRRMKSLLGVGHLKKSMVTPVFATLIFD